MTTAYRRAKSMTERQVGDKLFLISDADGQIVSLSPTAAGLWHLLAKSRAVAGIVERFSAAFPDQPIATIEADIASALRELAARGLIENSDPAVTPPRRSRR